MARCDVGCLKAPRVLEFSSGNTERSRSFHFASLVDGEIR